MSGGQIPRHDLERLHMIRSRSYGTDHRNLGSPDFKSVRLAYGVVQHWREVSLHLEVYLPLNILLESMSNVSHYESS